MTAATRIIINEIKGYHNFLKFMIFLVVLSALATMVRFIFGLGVTTNLNDVYPWGLWISFDVVTAVPLAAGWAPSYTVFTSRSWSRWYDLPS